MRLASCWHRIRRDNITAADYYPNPGNWGDELIRQATLQEAARLGIALHSMPLRHVPGVGFVPVAEPRNRIGIFGGGGNLVPYYCDMRNMLVERSPCYDRVFLLPHSMHGDATAQMLSRLGDTVTVFAREEPSYRFVATHWPHADTRLFFDHDLAFGFDYSPYLQSGNGVLHAFRTGPEATDIVLPPDNIDLSAQGKTGDDLDPFLATIARYERVCTNRLHVGIAAACMGKDVELHDNNYGKVRAVYRASMEGRFPTVRWMD